ncbi:MAG: hypothetical protein N2505_06455, partial [Endomicrobia bacterium]|nr:hypothetical protein [Endomicrobiia bacterium]
MYITLYFFLFKCSTAFNVLIFHDGRHPDHIEVLEEILSSKNISYISLTQLPQNLENYSLIILEYDIFADRFFDWKRDRIENFIAKGGFFLGFGDGGSSAAALLINITPSFMLYASSFLSEIMYKNEILFSNFSIGDTIDLGRAACYHVTYIESVNDNYIPWLKIKENNRILLFSSKDFRIFGFTIGCGGWINVENCKYIYNQIIELFLHINNKTEIKIISPLNKTYLSFGNSTQIQLEFNVIFSRRNFSLEVYINDIILLNESVTERINFKQNLNQPPGDYCIKIVARNNETILIKTLCYSIRKPSIYNKTLFITDENWKNILALSPLKIPTIVYKPEYKDY